MKSPAGGEHREAGSLVRSVAFRQALVYALLFSASVTLLFGFLYWSTAGDLSSRVEASVEAEQLELAESYRTQGLRGVTDFIRQRLSRQPAGPEIYLLAAPDYQRVAGNLSGWPDAEPDASGWVRFRLGSGADNADVRWASAKIFRLEGGYHLLVGRDMQELEAIRASIAQTLTWGLGITVVMALAGGALMGRSSANRVRGINAAIRRIMDGDLSQRMPSSDSGDEFDQLAGNLNLMLERIEGLMDGVRQVSDNIAHDLKTPLARMRNQLEQLSMDLQESPNGSEVGSLDAVNRAIAEADAMLATFSALLRIARIESAARHAGFREVDLRALLADVAELYEPLAEQRRQELIVNVDAGATVRGDRDLIFQAVANLVDNALKYAPEGGRAEVSLHGGARQAMIVVADNGPGIDAADRDKIFDRFWRADDSRSTPGSGLGLSLVHAVAQLHGADLVVDDNEPGLRIEMTFARP